VHTSTKLQARSKRIQGVNTNHPAAEKAQLMG